MARISVPVSPLSPVPIDLLKGHDPSVYRQAGNNQLQNLFISNNALFPTAGRERLTFNGEEVTFGNRVRAIYSSVLLNSILVVSDTLVFSYDPTTNRKDILNFSNPLQNDSVLVTVVEGQFISNTQNKKQIAICEYGAQLFIYDVDTKDFSKVTLPDGVLPGMVIFFDNFFIINDVNTNRFYISSINDGTVWAPLDFSQIRSKTVGITSLETQLLIFGRDLTEVFYNAGTTPFPFQPTTTISYEFGLLAPESLASSFGIVCWLAQNKNTSPIIVYTDGSGIKPISTENIDTIFIDKIQNVEDCRGFLFQENGHTFYTLTFFSDNVTLSYDFHTNKFTLITEETVMRSSVLGVINFKNNNYAFTENSKYLYRYGTEYLSNDGELIERAIITDTYISSNTSMPFCINKLSLNMQQGTLDKSGWCNLFVSKDKGVTFNYMGNREINSTGQTNSLLNFYNLGSSRFWTFKITMKSLSETVLLGAEMEVVQ